MCIVVNGLRKRVAYFIKYRTLYINSYDYTIAILSIKRGLYPRICITCEQRRAL
ncbi:hypothetical protein C7475_107150 [Chitinophaga sp. S165]|nr:hypothetical protein C7475_107150 [Chitinophaga sp. S165]